MSTGRRVRQTRARRWRDLAVAGLASIGLLSGGLTTASLAIAAPSGDDGDEAVVTELEVDAPVEEPTVEPSDPPARLPIQTYGSRGIGEYLNVAKSANNKDLAELKAGEEVEYKVQVSCSQQPCLNAKVVDELPNLSGFTFEEFVAPDQPHTLVWKDAAGNELTPTRGFVFSEGDYFEIAFTQDFDGTPGLDFGQTALFSLFVKVPGDFSPLDSRNGEELENKVTATADSTVTKEASADIKVTVERELKAGLAKTWLTDGGASTQPFSPGAKSEMTLEVWNASNVPVNQLQVTDPNPDTLVNGATVLADDNPFRYFDFTGFGSVAGDLPENVSTVQVDAYAWNGTTWEWVQGDPQGGFALPDGVDPGNVGGIRVTFTTDEGQTIPAGRSYHGFVRFQVEQRAEDRVDRSDLSLKSDAEDVLNKAQATSAIVEGEVEESSEPVDKQAPFELTPPTVDTKITKTISPNEVSKGSDSSATIGAENTGSAVETWTVSDLGFFDGNESGWVRNFGGFTAPIECPEAAQSGSVVFHLSNGTTQTVDLECPTGGVTPAVADLESETELVTGFVFEFKSAQGKNEIVTDAKFAAAFDIKTNGAVTISEKDAETNTATSKVVAANGKSKEKSDSDDLTVWEPAIYVEQRKTILPENVTVLPGESLIAELQSTAKPTVEVGVKQLVVTDETKGGDLDFWNGFNVTEILPTVVPDGYKLTINVKTQGGTWTPITTDREGTMALDATEFANAVGIAIAGPPPATPEDLVGVQFVFDAIDGKGVPSANLQVKPYLGFVAREDTRRDGSEVPTDKTTYTDTVVGEAVGKPPVGEEVESGPEEWTATGPVENPEIAPEPGPEPGPGASFLSKSWNKKWVTGLSGDTRTTTLRWNITSGNATVTLADPGDSIGNVKDSVFNAFNLTGVNPISVSNTAYSNGWYLKWDTISKIELHDGTKWVEHAAPGGSWQNTNGSFKRLTLTGPEQASTVGIRFTIVENKDARDANWATSNPSPDLLAPRSGEGVAWGLGVAAGNNSTNRNFVLSWQVRDKARDEAPANPWVTSKRPYNVTDDGGEPANAVVRNDVELKGFDGDGVKVLDLDASDRITILDAIAKVDVAKSVDPTSVVVPQPGAISAKNYPTASYTVTANNALGDVEGPPGAPGVDNTANPSRAQWVRVIDPNLYAANLDEGLVENTEDGALSNPFVGTVPSSVLGEDTPFNWFNITNLTLDAAKVDQINLDGTKVFLLYYEDDQFVTGEGTFDHGTGVVSVGAGHSMSDVVGFAVVFVSNKQPGPAGGGGMITKDNTLSIKVDTQLRTTLRASGADTAVDPGDTKSVENTAYGQLIRPEGVGPDDQASSAGKAELELLGEIIDVNPTKTIDPVVLYEPTAKAPVTVTLSADQGDDSNASPKKVWIEDSEESEGSDFWDHMNFVELTGLTAPAGADRALIEVLTDSGWQDRGQIDPATWATWTPPIGIDAEDVTGLRVTFTRAYGKVFSDTNDPMWNAEVKFETQLRDTTRETGDSITFPHGDIGNVVEAQSIGANAESVVKHDDATLKLEAGSRQMAIGKLANSGSRRTTGGHTLPWDLVIQNVGTGYLTIETIVDDLEGKKLVYTGENPDGGAGWSFNGPGGLPAPNLVDEDEGKKLTFEWTPGAKLAPGEKIEIRLWLQLQPGVTGNEKIYNEIDVSSDPSQPLDEQNGVVPYLFPEVTDPGNKADDAWQVEDKDNEGVAQDYVQISSGLAAQVYKGVSGSLPGATNVGSPERECGTFTAHDGDTYYRSPCAANSKPGGVDDWVVRIANAGTSKNWTNFWVVDPLPTKGDLMLVDGEPRGSDFRPVMTGPPEFEMIGMEPAIMAWVEMWVTYDVGNVCQGTWGELPWADEHPTDPDYWNTNGPCTQNGEEWISIGHGNEDSDDPAWIDTTDGIEWEKVTGIRIYYHDHEQVHTFDPGATFDLFYSTQNKVKSDEYPLGSSNVIPIPLDEFAWNQFGAAFRPEYAADGFPDRIAPNKVGTRLAQGSIQVEKTVEAPEGFPYLPDEFTATAECWSSEAAGGGQLSFGEEGETQKELTLTWDEDKKSYFSERIYGIPLESNCTVIEDGDLGEFGEYERDPGNVDFTVAVPDTEFDEDGFPTNDVPEGQLKNLSNRYAYGALEVTKQVVTAADRGTFGPFDFTLSCETSDGQEVTFPANVTGDSDKVAEFQLKHLEDGHTWTAPEDTIPVGSTCTLTEVNSDGAGQVVITGDNVTPGDTGSASIKVTGTEDNPTAVVSTDVANRFAAGTLEVKKVVEGAGAQTYGQGEFSFTASCEYKGEELLSDDERMFTLKDTETKAFGVFPVGTKCTIEETTTGGATSTVIEPNGGEVTIAGTLDEVGKVSVAATNTFDVGSLKINKVRNGEGADEYGAGPFEAQVSCTYDKDGETTEIVLLDVGKVVLSEANDYTATIGDLIVGAECSVTETDMAGAHANALTPDDGVVTIEESEQVVEVAITNTFNIGSVKIQKVVDGTAAKYGVGPFTAKMACTYEVGDEVRDVALPNGGVAELNVDNDYSAQFDGIYVGAQCTVEEIEAAGAHETVVTPSNGVVTVTESQQVVGVEIRNTFNTGEVSVTKKVITEADKGTFGPFDFTLACETTQGQTVTFPGAGEEELDKVSFTLARDETWHAPEDTIPVGSTCTLAEVEAGGATETVITGDNVEDLGDGSAVFVVKSEGTETAVVSTEVANHFPAGTVLVEKVVDGLGADAYGAGPFEFTAACEYNDEIIFDETFQLERDGTKTLGVFPAGTVCTIQETDAAGAHDSLLDPEDGVVTIIGPMAGEDGETPPVGHVSVTATNTFDVGSLEIIKKVTGDGAAELGMGPFEAQVSCTYEQGEETKDVALPNGGKVTLGKDNDYRATIDGIYAGATCKVIETKDGGADKTEIGPNGGVIDIDSGETVTVTITNTFGKLPKTGAQLATALFIAIALLAGGLFAYRASRPRGRHAA